MGRVKRWSGTKWEPVFRWSGTKWEPVYAWDGQWKPSAPAFGPEQNSYGSSVPTAGTTYTGSVGNDLYVLATGKITKLRYYRSAAASDTRTLRLWNSAGVQLSSVVATGDSGAGWKTWSLPSEINVNAGDLLRVSMDANGSLLREAHVIEVGSGDVRIREGYLGSTGLRPASANGNDWYVDAIFQRSLSASGPSIIGHTEGIDLPAGATSFQPALPSGLQTGDLILLAMFCTDNATGVTITPTVPAGWTVRTALATQGTCQRAFLTASYSDGLVMPSWALSAARRSGYACVAVRPAAGMVIGSTDLAASSTDLVAPSVAATAAGLAIRMFVRKDNLSTNLSVPAGHTQIGKIIGTTGPAPHVLSCYGPIAAAGATGSATSVCTAASANGTSWTVAVN